MADGGPALSLVVSTIGRPADLARLLRSVERSTVAGRVQLVVCDQSQDQSCARVLRESGTSVAWEATTSGRGASRGRNAGLRLATAPVVAFPDDNCWFPPTTLEQALAAFDADPSLAGVSGQQQTEDGRPSMLRWLATPQPVTRTNFMRTSIMSTMVFRRAVLDEVGWFDEGLGVGSDGWLGAGEESDLLLRVLDAGGRVDYDPTLVVLQEEPRDEADAGFERKMLRYGCGNGHLWRRHGLSRAQLAWYSARKVVGSVVRAARGQRHLARADVAYLRGTWAGWTGRPPRELAARVGP
ncbi:glycosyltransferase family 2 protein [Angustibacter speluncae]